MHRGFTATVLLALTTVACGEDDGGEGAGRDQEYVDAAMTSFDESDLPFDEDTAECLAAGFIDALGGAEAFEDAGIEPEDLTDEDFDPVELGLDLGEDEGRAMTEVFRDCDVSMADLLVAGVESDGAEVSTDLRACLDENIDEDAFAEVFGQAFVNPERFADEPPEEFTSLIFDLAGDCPELLETSG